MRERQHICSDQQRLMGLLALDTDSIRLLFPVTCDKIINSNLLPSVPLQGDLEEELYACIPTSISKECRELLLSLLQPNPDTRSSLQDIFRNPWFLRDLPEDVLSMNERCLKPKSA